MTVMMLTLALLSWPRDASGAYGQKEKKAHQLSEHKKKKRGFVAVI
jgi:hypothetical protein